VSVFLYSEPNDVIKIEAKKKTNISKVVYTKFQYTATVCFDALYSVWPFCFTPILRLLLLTHLPETEHMALASNIIQFKHVPVNKLLA